MPTTAMSIRGMLANPDAGLFFRFQFNPHEISTDKAVKYDSLSPAGWDRPILQYVNNGESTIEFDVMADSTPASGSANAVRAYGVLDVIAVMETFKLPQSFSVSSAIKNGVSLQTLVPNRTMRRFTQPPDCYFVYGLKWAKCKLVSAPVRQGLFNRALIPQRMFTKIKLVVIEDGWMADVADAERRVLAVLGSSITTGLSTIKSGV